MNAPDIVAAILTAGLTYVFRKRVLAFHFALGDAICVLVARVEGLARAAWARVFPKDPSKPTGF